MEPESSSRLSSNATSNGGSSYRRSSSFRFSMMTVTPSPESAPGSSSSASFAKYDSSFTMDRMRSSMIGENRDLLKALREVSSSDRTNEHDLQDSSRTATSNFKAYCCRCMLAALGQVPAVALIAMFHLMIGIPFGVSYFPIGWREAGTGDLMESGTDDKVHGAFPLPGKESLGIRMFLFATMVGQVCYSLLSGFGGPIGLQMVENVPFTHALAQICIKHQGYGIQALSSSLLLFAVGSIVVGGVFMVLGKFNLGRIVYYFPSHVLVGLIAGIGVYLFKTGIEVTMDAVFTWENITSSLDLLITILLFEVVLRLLDWFLRDAHGNPLYSLLSPIYFCMITPVFYVGLWIFSVDFKVAEEAGYFFPSLTGDADGDSLFQNNLFDMWTAIELGALPWAVLADAIPTLISLTLFSLIHVPINIPALSLSTNTEVDMNVELVAHGYSNMISGLCGGLQNYMAYTQSVVFFKSGGKGKISGLVVALVTIALFVVGPAVASYIPRCMAGTLLVHVGIDLFVEGVCDSFPKFDGHEYLSVLLIITVMTLVGMDAAMLMGVLTAIFAFVAQNLTYVDPVRGAMTAATLRSDERNRPHKARAILDDPVAGRIRILVIQLQGHVFFGNIVNLTKNVTELLSERIGRFDQPVVVILDFALILGIDSTAAQSLIRLKSIMRKEYGVKLSIFNTGSPDGFPCEFDLSRELTARIESHGSTHSQVGTINEGSALLTRVSSQEEVDAMVHAGSHVTEDSNQALVYAENFLIARHDPALLENTEESRGIQLDEHSSISDEREVALRYLVRICPAGINIKFAQTLFSKFAREVYFRDDYLWRQGSQSTSIKLLVRGSLLSVLENEAGTEEIVRPGNLLGELGVIEDVPRFSSVQCLSDEAIVYSLIREDYHELVRSCPQAARLIELICIRYLSARVQHISNRVFETRCLPI